MKPLIKLQIYKFFKNPFNISFSVIFPIVWNVTIALLWGKYSIKFHGNDINMMNFIMPSIVIFLILSFTIANVPIILGSDRLDKRIKHISLAEGSRKKYLLSLIIFYYCSYLIIFTINLAISLIFFNLEISARMILTLIFLPLFIFYIHFMLSIIIANNTTTLKNNTFVTIIALYALMFLTGATVPTYVLDPKDIWFKYVQYLSPTGCSVVLMQYLCNGLNTGEVWWLYLILIGYTGLLSYLAVKTFKWE